MTRTSAILGLAGSVCIIAAVTGCVREGNAHDAPSGWAYPLECCSNRDCREVTGAAVEERDGGFVIAATGERISYRDPRLRDSPDGVVHWCSAAGAADGRTICLFVPPRSF